MASTNLGNLYYSLGLDDRNFTKKMQDAAKLVDSLKTESKINIDTKDVSNAQAMLNRLKSELDDLKGAASIDMTGIPKNIDITGNVTIDAENIKTQVENALTGVTVRDIRVDTESARKAFQSQMWNVNVTTDQGSIRTLVDKVKNVLGLKNITIRVTPDWSKNALSKLQTDLQKSLKNIPLDKIKVLADRKALQDQLNAMRLTVPVDIKVNTVNAQNAVKTAMNGTTLASATSEGNKLGNEQVTIIEKQNKGLTDQLGIRKAINNQMSTNTQLATMFGNLIGNVFATNQIQRFLEGLVNVGGEIQKQRMSLEHILQSESQANTIFNQMKGLAVQSPFGLLDLMQNARQLSAFGVEYNKLYDTMKRLSDIAAGLGIEFSRLSLAYGETMERGVLDGKLVRQFAYQGIPVLQKVADYYTKIGKLGEGVKVTAREVREMVSDRKVSFQDLDAVIKGMTEPGGQFNNMQEVMAESVAGKWKNLADAVDIMYSEIAEGNSGILKAPAEILTTLTRHYDELAIVLEVVAIRMVGAKVSALLYASTMGKVAAASWSELEAESANKTAIELRTAAMNKSNLSKLISIARSKQITVQQIKELASDKELTKAEQAELAVRQKSLAMKLSLTAENIKYMHSLGLVTTNQKAYATSSNFLIRQYGKMSISMSLLNMQIKQVAASFAAMSVAMLTNPMTWIMVAVSGLLLWNEKSDEAKQKQNELADASAKAKEEMLKSSTELSKSVGNIDSDSATTGELQTAIKDMVEFIKNNAADAPSLLEAVFAKDKDGNYIKNIKQRFTELEAIIEEFRNYAGSDMDFTSTLQEAFNDYDGIFDDSPLENTQQFIEAQRNALEGLSNTLLHIPISLSTKAFDKIRQQYHDEILSIFNVSDIQQVRENQLKQLIVSNKSMLKDFVDAINTSGNLTVSGWYTGLKDSMDTMLKDIVSVMYSARKTIQTTYSETGKPLDWNDENVKRQWEQDVKQTITVQYGDQNAEKAVQLMQTIMNDPNLYSKMQVDANTNPDDAAKKLLQNEDLYKNLWLIVRRAPNVDDEDTYEKLLGSDAKGATDYVDAIEKVEKAAKDHYSKLQRMAKENKIKLKKDSDGLYSIDSADKTTQAWKDAKTQLNALNNELRKAQEQNITLDYLGKSTSSKSSTRKEDTWLKTTKEEFDELKKAYSEYKKWADKTSREEATSKMKNIVDFSQFSKYGIKAEDIFDLQSYQNAVKKMYAKIQEQLQKSPQRQKLGTDFKVTIDDIDIQLTDEAIKRANDKVANEINNAAKQYDLWKTWFNATGDNDLAMKMSVTLTPVWDERTADLKQQLDDALSAKGIDASKFLSGMFDKNAIQSDIENMFKNISGDEHDGEALYKKYKSIYDQIWSAGMETAKALAESGKELMTVADKMELIEDKWDRLIEEDKNTTGGKNTRRLTGQKEYEELLASTTYIQFMQRNLTLSQNEMNEFAEDIKNRLTEAFKKGGVSSEKYAETIKKITEEQKKYTKNSYGSGSFGMNTINEAISKMYDKGSQQVAQGAQDYASALEQYNKASQNMDFTQMFNSTAVMQSAEGMQEAGASMMGAAEGMDSTVAVIDMIIHGINDTVQGLKQMASYIDEMLEAYGSDTGANSSWGEFKSYLDIFATSSQHATNSWDDFKNGDVAGMVTEQVGSVTSIFTGLAKQHDAKLQEIIEESQLENEKLQNIYGYLENALERTMGGVYSLTLDDKSKSALENIIISGEDGSVKSKYVDTHRYSEDTRKAAEKALEDNSYYEAQYANLLAQKEELQMQLDAENDKKDTDDSAIVDFQEQITDLEDQIAYFAEDMMSELYGIDFKDWASQLGDALVDAWASGEDAAEAYEDTVKDLIKSVTKSVISQSIIETALKPTLDTFKEKFVNADGQLDMSQITYLTNSLNALYPQLNTAVTSYLEQMKNYGVDLADSDSSSSTSSSIQGVTEETADILSALIQGIRLDLSIQRTAVEQIRDAIGAGENTRSLNAIAEAQVLQLQQIATNTYNTHQELVNLNSKFDEVTSGTKSLSIQ